MPGSTYPMLPADDFARRSSMRGNGLMWLLGAGASAAAGIPTAGDMIVDFKQRLYVSQRRVSAATVADLSSPAVRARLQDYIDSLGRFPPQGAPDEYAALFEAVYASESDRQTYLDGKLSGTKPSYGHIALATLMKGDRTRVVWTTNFDPLVADACARVYDGTGFLTSVDLDAPVRGRETFNAQRWPLEVKLHGDFRSRRLKNTTDELRHQDAQLRDLLRDACGRHGLIVAGYSGRDESVMAALESALKQPTPFPFGLFWLNRGEEPPLPRVVRLLEGAAAAKVDGGLVPIDNFDETLRDLVRLLEGELDTAVLDRFADSRQVWTPVPSLSGARGFPVIRLNGLPLTDIPSCCRLIGCKIGGSAEVIEAVEAAKVDVLAARTRAGVLAFGADADCRAAFEPFGIDSFDLHTIEKHRLRYDSQERGLLRRALSKALMRAHGLDLVRRRNSDLLAPLDGSDERWAALASVVDGVSGTVRGYPELGWREGVSVRLDWADDRVWLLFEPNLVFSGRDNANRDAATDFARERTVRRYNRELNSLLEFWNELLSGGGSELRALGIATGVDATFRLGMHTAYSRRLRA